MKIVYTLEEIPVFHSDSIFLAGPTPRDRETQSWRPEAIKILKEIGFDGIIFYPEFNPNKRDLLSNKAFDIATEILDSGRAWKKFQAICEAQGGMRELVKAKYTHVIPSPLKGKIVNIDNRRLARLAKLAGAPHDKSAGLVLHTQIDTLVEKDQPLFTIHSESKGSMRYALSLLEDGYHVVEIEEFE